MCKPTCPDGSAPTGVAGHGTSAPQSTAGSIISTAGDLTWLALNAGIEWKGDKICMSHGPMVSIVRGNKHKHTIGFDETAHLGAKLEEIGGFESKLAMAGDVRDITAVRWERNVGLKAESVLGDVNEHTMAGEHQTVPETTTEVNPTTRTQKAPQHEEVCKKIVEQFKARMVESRKALVYKIHEAKWNYKEWTREFKTYTGSIEKYSAKFHEYAGKINGLKEKVRDYKDKADKFFKALASGGMKLKAASVSGRARKKIHFISQTLAQFKGDIKLGG